MLFNIATSLVTKGKHGRWLRRLMLSLNQNRLPIHIELYFALMTSSSMEKPKAKNQSEKETLAEVTQGDGEAASGCVR
jgi:hypothetical protein